MANPTVITGAASGLGAAVAARLRREPRDADAEPRKVIGIDVQQAAGVDVIADLGTPEGRAHAIEEVLEVSGGAIDGLVSCAAASPIHPDPAVVVSVNHFGALGILDGLLDALTRGDRPAAVAISSIGSVAGPFDEDLTAVVLAGDEEAARAAAADGTEYRSAIAYNSAKVGVARGVRERSAAWAGAGVRLNAVAPGRMETPMLDGLVADPVIAAGLEFMPTGIRLSATAEEIGGAVVFLLGEDASFVHGQVLFVDGGVEAQMRPDQY